MLRLWMRTLSGADVDEDAIARMRAAVALPLGRDDPRLVRAVALSAHSFIVKPTNNARPVDGENIGCGVSWKKLSYQA